MLSPPDRELVRRDRAVPGLPVLLDPAAFVDVLNTALPDAGVRAGWTTYVRYKPQTSCLVGYALETDHGRVRVHARAHRLADADKLHKASEQPGVPGPLGPGRLVLENCATSVSVFPNDWALKGLARINDATAREELLRGI